MNKQELIDILKRQLKVMPGASGGPYDGGYEYATKHHLAMIANLDEPEKPVVPQYVANFYESIKDDFEDGVYELCIQLYNCDLDGRINFWFGCNDNKPIETLVKMKLYGYEVKKEKLYVVFQVATKEYLYTNVFGELRSAYVSREFVEESEEYHFTQQKLEGLNYWNNPAFEIEEVEE